MTQADNDSYSDGDMTQAGKRYVHILTAWTDKDTFILTAICHKLIKVHTYSDGHMTQADKGTNIF